MVLLINCNISKALLRCSYRAFELFMSKPKETLLLEKFEAIYNMCDSMIQKGNFNQEYVYRIKRLAELGIEQIKNTAKGQ